MSRSPQTLPLHVGTVLFGTALGFLSISAAKAGTTCSSLGLIDMGNGGCARVESRIRVEPGTRNAGLTEWGAGGTSSAALQSGGTDMLKDTGELGHLRVRRGLDNYTLFR